MIEAKNIQYLIPTMCSDLGELIKALPGADAAKNCLSIHEDDWRQVELVSQSQSKLVACEIASVRAIYEHKRNDTGFTALHLRSQFNALENCQLSVHDLKAKLGCQSTYAGISYFLDHTKSEGLVKDGFAFQGAGGLTVYGVEAGGYATSIGIVPQGVNDVAGAASTLLKLLKEHKLSLVDWCRAAQCQSNSELLQFFDTQL